MFGAYSSDALGEMNAQRTNKAADLIKKFEGEVKDIYALLGEIDVMLIVDFPGIEQAMKASVALSKMTGIAFTTSPAVTVEKFDEMMRGI